MISPSSRSVDTGTKLADYFRLASVRHYIVIEATTRRATHHRRDEDGRIVTGIASEGERLALDPPGIEVAVPDFFAAL